MCWKRSLQHRASAHQSSPQSSSSAAAPTFPPPTLEASFYYPCRHWRGLRSPQPLNPHGPPAPLVSGSTGGSPGMNVVVMSSLSPVRAPRSPLHLPLDRGLALCCPPPASASCGGGQGAGMWPWCQRERACSSCCRRSGAQHPKQGLLPARLCWTSTKEQVTWWPVVPAPKPYLNRASSRTQTALPAPPAPAAAPGAAPAELIFSPHPALREQLPRQDGRHLAAQDTGTCWGGDVSNSCCRVSPFPLCARPSVPALARGLSGCKLELVQILGQGWQWPGVGQSSLTPPEPSAGSAWALPLAARLV